MRHNSAIISQFTMNGEYSKLISPPGYRYRSPQQKQANKQFDCDSFIILPKRLEIIQTKCGNCYTQNHCKCVAYFVCKKEFQCKLFFLLQIKVAQNKNGSQKLKDEEDPRTSLI